MTCLCCVTCDSPGARNYSQCDSMLIGDQAGANTYPYIQVGVWGGLFLLVPNVCCSACIMQEMWSYN